VKAQTHQVRLTTAQITGKMIQTKQAKARKGIQKA